jgi:ACS family hexuronate transporter-like MFS transporter
MGRYRWRIVALLFFATTICYMDRVVLSMVSADGTFQHDLLGISYDTPLTDADDVAFKKIIGDTNGAFMVAYALGFLLVGWFIDKIGVRKGLSIALTLWSIAGILHGFVRSAFGLLLARFTLGVGEAGNFPSAGKTISEWFPKKDRSKAMGFVNAGANIGTIVTALLVPIIIVTWGWRASFIIIGLLGLILVFFWNKWYYNPHEKPNLDPNELAYIEAGQEPESNEKVSWITLFKYRETWAFAGAKFLTDGVWFFFLTWLPLFFKKNELLDKQLDFSSIGFTFVFIYIISDLGSIFFGWLATKMANSGMSVNKARKVTILICGLCAIPVFFAAFTTSYYIAVGIIALGTAAHQGFSTNILTIPSDLFPKKAVASVIGIGGFCGAIASASLAIYVGRIDGFIPVFIYGSTAYLIALVWIHLMTPKMKKVEL